MVARCGPGAGATFQPACFSRFAVRATGLPGNPLLESATREGPGIDRAGVHDGSGTGLQASAGAAPEGDTIFQRSGFSRVKVAPRSLQACPPLLYEAHRRNIASI
jgi:hypothetical protein